MDNREYPAGYWTLVLDLECTFCSRFASFVRKFDINAVFNVFSVAEFMKQSGSIDENTLKSDMHIFGRNGESVSGAEALKTVIGVIPQMKPFRWMIETGFGRKAADLAYLTMKRLKSCGNCGKKRLE